MADRAGQAFGQYRLVRFIKGGGFGDVYEATHTQKGRVALKLLKRQLDEQGLRDFLNDVRAVLLRHPNIIEVVDFGMEGQPPFLAMPYYADGSLRGHHLLPLPLPTIVEYVQQIAGALQYAHDQGTIHRDVKPDNVLLGLQSTLILADFGIAVIFDPRKTHQTVEQFVGSLEYAAPEQFLQKPGPASDQYALATMVYEWLSGKVPFPLSETPDFFAMGKKKTQELPPRLVGVPSAIERVVQQALAIHPQDRFPSVKAFADALEQVVMTALAKDPRERFGSMRAFAAIEAAYQTDASFLSAPTQRVIPSTLLTPLPKPPAPLITSSGLTPPVTEPPVPGSVLTETKRAIRPHMSHYWHWARPACPPNQRRPGRAFHGGQC